MPEIIQTQLPITPLVTLHDAKAFVDAHREDGVRCPCCDRWVKVWRKKIISVAAASLVRLVRLYKGEAIHLDDFNVEAKDRNFSQLVLWELAQPDVNDDTGKRASGRWWPTDKGILFVQGKIKVPKYILTDDNSIIETEGPEIDIHEVLGNRYNHAELMSENYGYARGSYVGQ